MVEQQVAYHILPGSLLAVILPRSARYVKSRFKKENIVTESAISRKCRLCHERGVNLFFQKSKSDLQILCARRMI